MILLRAGNPSEWTGPTGNNTYLATGPDPLLIDAGVGAAAHLAAIADALDGTPLRLLLITHSHSDHAAGVPALVSRWPSLRVRGGPGEPIHDGESFQAGGSRLVALHTPGHAPDHFCFLDEETRDIYSGDLARIGGSVVIPASRGGNLQQYLDSLHLLRALKPSRLLPAHGPAVEDPIALIDQYLAHRAMRERQVQEALAAGCTTTAQIVERIYPGLSPSLLDAAGETVAAHLLKLGHPLPAVG